MLHDSKDMPKFQTITDEKSIEKYGGDRMYFAPPIEYDKVMRLVPFGKLLTIGRITSYNVCYTKLLRHRLDAQQLYYCQLLNF